MPRRLLPPDEAAEISEDDVERAKKWWRRYAPVEFRLLLDATPIPSEVRDRRRRRRRGD